jgi:phage terminase Nu1 subunit (DNA packaging protein)
MGSAPFIAEMPSNHSGVLPCFEPGDLQPSVSTDELAEILQISSRRIRQLVLDGVLPREKRGRYDIAESSKCYIAFLQRPEVSQRRAAALGLSGTKKITASRQQLIQCQAERQQLRLEQERGVLIPIDVFRREVGKAFRVVRDNLLRLPAQLAPQLVGESLVIVHERLDAGIRRVLTALSRTGSEPALAPADGLQTSAKAKREQI